MHARPPRILISRTDRLGDVLLTTPLARVLRERWPGARIVWLVRPYTGALLENNPDADEVLHDDGGPIDGLIERLRRDRFDIALLANARWRPTWAAWAAGVPIRVGPASKLYSLLLSHPLVQHRSRGERHEVEHNLALLRPLGIEPDRVAPRLAPTPAERAEAAAWLARLGVAADAPFVALHPGGGGSAERWPPEHFRTLARALRAEGIPVVVTAGPNEDWRELFEGPDGPVLAAPGPLRRLAALLSRAAVLVASSTGPLHIAVALGTPTISLYSPHPSAHPRRWGPFPEREGDPAHVVLLAPTSAPPGERMALLDPAGVFQLCLEVLRGNPHPSPEP